jgi:hypothetical protein
LGSAVLSYPSERPVIVHAKSRGPQRRWSALRVVVRAIRWGLIACPALRDRPRHIPSHPRARI